MPIHHEGSGWQWGSHGKVYPSREGAERQAAAAHAHGFTGDAAVNAAGIVFCTPEGKALFLKRSDAGDHPGEWCLPGGHAEDGESPLETARRECIEEIGDCPEGYLDLLGSMTSDEGVEFSTFRQLVNDEFEPELNHEHTEYVWAPIDSPPEPLHPGVRGLLDTPGKVSEDCLSVVGDENIVPKVLDTPAIIALQSRIDSSHETPVTSRIAQDAKLTYERFTLPR